MESVMLAPEIKTTSEKAEPAHFSYIDAVRGLAFLAVLTVHASSSVGAFPGREIFVQGIYGVQLFFLASAITLCNSMSSRQTRDKFPIAYFYLRRLFRIAPLFWCAIVFYRFCPGIMPNSWRLEWAPTGVPGSYYFLTAIFLHGWHPYTFNSIVPGGWSIAVEMTFYVFFPLLFRYVNSLKRSVLAVLISLIYARAMMHIDAVHHLFPGAAGNLSGFFSILWFPAQLPVFMVGFLAYHLLKNDSIKGLARSRFYSNSMFWFCVMLLLSLFRGQSGFIPTNLLIVLSLAGIIISISGRRLWLVNPVICYIGKISYSCYLVHFAALEITRRLLGIHLASSVGFFDAGSSKWNLLLFMKIFTITLILTAIVSTITLHLIENPGIAMGKKFIKRISSLSGTKVIALLEPGL